MTSIEKKLEWFTKKIDALKKGWGKLTNFFSSGDDKKSKTMLERQSQVPKTLRVPANNPLYNPTKAPLHQKGINPRATLLDSLKSKEVLPKAVKPVKVESPSKLTAKHISSSRVETHNQTKKQTATHITHNTTIIAKGTSADEVIAIMKQQERASISQQRDLQLKDIA